MKVVDHKRVDIMPLRVCEASLDLCFVLHVDEEDVIHHCSLSRSLARHHSQLNLDVEGSGPFESPYAVVHLLSNAMRNHVSGVRSRSASHTKPLR